MDDANNNESTFNEILDLHCETFQPTYNTNLWFTLHLFLCIYYSISAVQSWRDGSRALRRLRNAVPSTGRVLSHRIRTMPDVEYCVTLKFLPSLPSAQYLPPDSIIPLPPLPLVSIVESPSNDNTASDALVGEYRVSWNEYCNAVDTGHLTMLFDPGKPGIELPPSVHNYNLEFFSAFLFLISGTYFCCFMIGWLISLFQNEVWCGMAEYILWTAWIVPPTILCCHYCWCNYHHQSAVPLETVHPSTEYC